MPCLMYNARYTLKQQIISRGEGKGYEWSNDHILLKAGEDLTNGRLTLVEDRLKPGFHLARHYHKQMTEIFYVLEGSVEFTFDDNTVSATPGMTIIIQPALWHEVRSEKGGTLLTMFSPGGFEKYLEELAALPAERFEDQEFMKTLAERHDIWMQ